MNPLVIIGLGALAIYALVSANKKAKAATTATTGTNVESILNYAGQGSTSQLNATPNVDAGGIFVNPNLSIVPPGD